MENLLVRKHKYSKYFSCCGFSCSINNISMNKGDEN